MSEEKKPPGLTQEQLQRAVQEFAATAHRFMPLTESEHPDVLVIMGNPATGNISLNFECPLNAEQPAAVRMALCACWLRKCLISILSDPNAAQAFAAIQRAQQAGESGPVN